MANLENNLDDAIKRALHQHVDAVLAEVEEQAIERLRMKIREARSNIVMSVFAHFEVARHQHHITITVHDKVAKADGALGNA